MKEGKRSIWPTRVRGSMPSMWSLLGVDVGRWRGCRAGHPVKGFSQGINLSGTMDAPKLESGLVMVNERIGEAVVDQFDQHGRVDGEIRCRR